MVRTGADMLNKAADALMADIWADSMALVVDVSMNRAGALSRALW